MSEIELYNNKEFLDIIKEDDATAFISYITTKNILDDIKENIAYRGERILFIVLQNGSINIFKYLVIEHKILDLFTNGIRIANLLHHVMIGYYNFMNNTEGYENNIHEIFQDYIVDNINIEEYINEFNSYRTTPLIDAIMSGHPDVVNFLIEKGANINQFIDIRNYKNNYKFYPIHLAIIFGYKKVVKCLLKNDADPDKKFVLSNGKSVFPHEIATMLKNPEIADILEKNGSIISNPIRLNRISEEFFNILNQFLPSVVSYHNDNLFFVKILIEKCHMNPNAKDRFSKTSLHIVSSYYKLSLTTQYLVEKADIEAIDKKGRTPLHYACNRCILPIVEYLVSKGANIKVEDNKKRTPLHYACRLGAIYTIEYLVSKDADIEAKDKEGKTPLDYALENNHRDIVRFLQEKKMEKIENEIQQSMEELEEVDFEENSIANIIEIDSENSQHSLE